MIFKSEQALAEFICCEFLDLCKLIFVAAWSTAGQGGQWHTGTRLPEPQSVTAPGQRPGREVKT